ncbi:MAG: phosphoribosylanthranilate isomerase, partial [Bacillota bacterium]|nr:phosphoribosylanthranilate isomerase [Bacillota bacterium]
MTKIKICGITRLKEIEFINELQPEYAGFVFAKSRRRISLEQCVTLSEALDKNIKRVGVFVNEDIENVKKAVKEAGLQVVQLHGDEDQAYIDSLKGVEVWKAISVSKTSDVENAGTYSVQGLVFDSMLDGIRGGTGKSFDWNILKGFT